MLDNIFIDPPQPARYAVLWFHGLGADGNDFAPVGHELLRLTQLPIRFIFPHAPERPVTLNNGYIMRAWYDIFGLDINSKEDRLGLDEISHKVDEMIQHQIKLGIPAENIFLGGFSQGGAVALYTGLRYAHKLAGIIGLSTYLPFRDFLSHEKHPENLHTPIFLAHGTHDPVLPYEWATLSKDMLEKTHHNVVLKNYPMAHTVCQEEIEALAEWIKALI
ncbi:MAG: carboxylesterase [Gammaproteobacteria bacterium]|nr:carboxylesterase [Gammaproteobacteria bacterium]